MPYLSWISDENLLVTTEKLLVKAKHAKNNASEKLHKNVLDPFSAMFQIAGFEISGKEFNESEINRQAQKSYQNHVGTFHQEILGSVRDWRDLKTGNLVDLVNEDKKIIAEVKNKHNTVTGSKLCDVYDVLRDAIMPNVSMYKGYTGYFVNIIPKKSERFNKPFTPSDNKTKTSKPLNNNIRIIDGASFYELVTGDSNALEDLFEVLPKVINDCSGTILLDKDEISLVRKYFDKAF